MELCKPSLIILLVATAGVLYHFGVGDFHGMIWWLTVGVAGTGVFQGLCMGGLEPVGWILMALPVLVVCFFLAVALFASSMRIDTVRCNRCETLPEHEDEECEHREENNCPRNRCPYRAKNI